MITVEKPKQFMKITSQVPDPVLYMMLIKERPVIDDSSLQHQVTEVRMTCSKC